MRLEDRIVRALDDRLDLLDLPAGDLEGALRLGGRVRRRRRLVAAAVGMAVALLTTGVLVLAPDRADSPEPAAPHGTWDRLPTPPLSPRMGSLTGWTGSEVLVVAGRDGPPCYPSPGCVGQAGRPLRDGAAFDPETGSWRRLARAPAPLWPDAPHVMAGDSLVVGLRLGGWLRYDASEDSWRRIDVPAGVPGPTTADQDTIFALDGRRVWALDLATDGWSRIPADRLEPTLQGRALFASHAGLALSGVDPSSTVAGEPVVQQVDVWDGSRWNRLPPTRQVEEFTFGDGARLVGVWPGGPDEGRVSAGEARYSYGGTLDLATGAWEPLAPSPALTRDAFPLAGSMRASGRFEQDAPVHGGNWFFLLGLAHDSETGQWWEPGRPERDLDWGISGVWAGDRLVTFGGYDEAAGFANPQGLSDAAWVWTPGEE